MLVDLHSHTTASDGICTPTALVALARSGGVQALAITDHDTLGGVGEAIAAAAGIGLDLIPGVEISCAQGARELHILGHFVEPGDQALGRALEGFRHARRTRMEQMIERCKKAGLALTLAEVTDAGGEALARPHLARALVRKGYARDVQDAFDRYLGAGRSAWVPRALPDAREVIELLVRAGACASIAHPAVSGVGEQELPPLVEAGVVGLEVSHPSQSEGDQLRLAGWARRYGLCPTGGSDFHGEGAEGARPGTYGISPEALVTYAARAANPKRHADLH